MGITEKHINRHAIAIIGANLGDEGKGLTTDYYCSALGAEQSLVVRYNGGAQAGHTVQTTSNIRHIFGHFGSGTLAGSPTYLSEFFVTNPVLFNQEHEKLVSQNIYPKTFIHPDCPVTTLYDMTINQAIESHRGKKEHGSCGVGFGETLARDEYNNSEFKITVSDLKNIELLKHKLNCIYKNWIPIRLKELGIDKLPKEQIEFLEDINVQSLYLDNIAYMLEHSSIKTLSNQDSLKYNIIFEGAQGLLLDENHHWFPHVTRSSTGLKNIIRISENIGINKLDINYITRAYLTRHGAGPLPFETDGLIYPDIIDNTNIPNKYQGSLRFAPFNLDLLKNTINKDWLKTNETQILCSKNLVITCLDQVEKDIRYISENKECRTNHNDFLNKTNSKLNLQSILTSYGPTRKTVHRYNLCEESLLRNKVSL
jgi:adenylosuccinate synthase